MDDRARDETSQSMSESTTLAMQEVLDGRRTGLSVLMPFAGPAVVVSVAYMDPGNFATNIQAGARYGYGLLWVVLLANVIAMLFQALSAKLGIVTGRNLAELCRDHFPKPLVYLMWAVSEVAAMATDLAEFLGGAIGLSLLFHMPILIGMIVTAIVTYGLLFFEKAGYRPLELVIGALVGIIGLSYLAELFIAPVAWAQVGLHLFSPSLPDAQAVTIAVGIIGATVMPHALFLHSGLTQRRLPARTDAERKKVVMFSNVEVVIALTIAGMINMAMVIMASGAFHSGHPEVAEIETAYHTLAPLAWHRGCRHFSLVADRVGNFEFGRGNHGRSDDHAGFCRISDSAVAASRDYDAAKLCRGLDGCERDASAGHESGRAKSGATVSNGGTGLVHLQEKSHGFVPEWNAGQVGVNFRGVRSSVA